jgi:hypothetical protein
MDSVAQTLSHNYSISIDVVLQAKCGCAQQKRLVVTLSREDDQSKFLINCVSKEEKGEEKASIADAGDGENSIESRVTSLDR